MSYVVLAVVALVLLLAAAVFLQCTVFSGDRIRRMRWRIRFFLHPGPGFASHAEMAVRWSRLSALHHGRRARPSLTLLGRLLSPTTHYAVRLGRGPWLRRLYTRNEDERLIIAAKRTGKSGIVADRLLDHPGPALASTSRTDLYDSTSGARALRGPVYRFNPEHVGDVPNDVRWDILAPCQDLLMARRIASWLKVPGEYGDVEWFSRKGDVALGACLWAAAVSGGTILDVYQWIQLHGHARCLEILATHPGSSPQMFAVVKRMFEENKTSGSIRDTIDLTLSWAILPGLAEIVTPPPGEGFSVADFTRRCGTLYLIASGDDDSPVTPLFRALAMWTAFQAGLEGSRMPWRRLEPPLLMSMDEVAITCPIDLPGMLSDSAGKGVLIEPVCHSVSQLKHRYGVSGADTIWALCGTKVLLGAISDPETLERASGLCGTAGDEPVIPPDLIRMLPDWRALVIRMNLRPVVVKVRPAWHRLAYRLGRHPLPAPHLVRTPYPGPVPALESVPEPAAPEAAVPAALNGHGGKPGHLVDADTP